MFISLNMKLPCETLEGNLQPLCITPHCYSYFVAMACIIIITGNYFVRKRMTLHYLKFAVLDGFAQLLTLQCLMSTERSHILKQTCICFVFLLTQFNSSSLSFDLKCTPSPTFQLTHYLTVNPTVHSVYQAFPDMLRDGFTTVLSLVGCSLHFQLFSLLYYMGQGIKEWTK